ncbi:hypothetical protein ACP0HM_09370 [Escherichia coli]
MLIVNPDTHRPLVLLPGRDQRTLATRVQKNIRKYRLSRVIAVESMRQQHVKGAPQARQVADRWHLLKKYW